MQGVATTILDTASEEQLAAWRREFSTAQPFPHIVLDDFVSGPELDALREAFPPEDWDGWKHMGRPYQTGKRYCSDIEVIPGPLRDSIIHLNSPHTLKLMEEITGIERLISDPYLDGAGLHASGPGGVLVPHSDFHHHHLDIFRRLNLLVYLNDDGWTEADGGSLELYPDAEAEETPKRVVPVAGRAVLFRTDEGSVHGFTQPVAEGKERRSIALYYYTSSETEVYSGDRTTVWRHHGEHSGLDRSRLAAYRGLMKVSRGMSILAHRINPNR